MADSSVIDGQLREQQLSRSTALLGGDAMQALRAACIVLIGGGAVASHTALHLARSGVGRLVLVQAPTSVTASVTTMRLDPCVHRADVAGGATWSQCVQRRVRELWPDDGDDDDVVVEHAASIEQLAGRAVDAVAVCRSDDVARDVEHACRLLRAPLVAVVDASWAGVADVTRLRVSALCDSSLDDTAARRVRRSLLRRDVRTGVALVHANRVAAAAHDAAAAAAAVLTTLGSVVAGQLMAVVTGALALEWRAAPAFGTWVRDVQSRFLTRYGGGAPALSLVEYVVDCMWNQRSARSRRAGKLALVVVARDRPVDQFNLLPLLDDECAAFVGLAAWTDEQRAFVDAVWAHERRLGA